MVSRSDIIQLHETGSETQRSVKIASDATRSRRGVRGRSEKTFNEKIRKQFSEETVRRDSSRGGVQGSVQSEVARDATISTRNAGPVYRGRSRDGSTEQLQGSQQRSQQPFKRKERLVRRNSCNDRNREAGNYSRNINDDLAKYIARTWQ